MVLLFLFQSEESKDYRVFKIILRTFFNYEQSLLFVINLFLLALPTRDLAVKATVPQPCVESPDSCQRPCAPPIILISGMAQQVCPCFGFYFSSVIW